MEAEIKSGTFPIFPVGYVLTLYYVLYTLSPIHPIPNPHAVSPIHCELQHAAMVVSIFNRESCFDCLLCGWQMQCHTDTTSSTRYIGQDQLITLYFWEVKRVM